MDLFGWSTAATSYGISTSRKSADYSGDFKDWGTAIDNQGTWRTLSKDEWMYLLNTRAVNGGTGAGKSYQLATINSDAKGVYGLIIYPDNYTAQTTAVTYTSEAWTAMEAAGCVFLPAAGYRDGSTVFRVGAEAICWSSSPDESCMAYFACLNNATVGSGVRYDGFSVRLVKDVPAAE